MAAPDDIGPPDRGGRARARRGTPSREALLPTEEHLRLRTELMEAVRDVILRRGLRQADAAALFGVAQPRVSDLVRGKIELFSIDTLVGMLAAAGVRTDIKLRPVRRGKGPVAGHRTPRR